MASANAGPITGGELIRAVQGGFEVWFSRAQFAAFLALLEQPSPRIYGTPTAFDGSETIRAVQRGSTIRLQPEDLALYLAGTAAPDIIPDRYRPTDLSGSERILGAQGDTRMAFTTSEILAIKNSGGSAFALRYSDGTPLTYSDGVYLEYSA